MFKVIGLYRKTEKAQEFTDFLINELTPQVLSIPGVIKVDITHLMPSASSPNAITPENDYFLMCEIYFASPEALQQVLNSEKGKQIAEVWLNEAASFLTAYVGKEESFKTNLFTHY